MAKSKGISKLFLPVVSLFTENYLAESLALSNVIMAAKRDIKRQLTEKAAERLYPIVETLFTDGIKASNTLVKADVARNADLLSQPFKYNKDVINTINGNSAFTGFYDTETKSLFKKREVDALKNKILQGKYSGWSDRQLQSEIRKTVNVSKNRALVIARNETARLETASNQIFFQMPKVQEEYDLVWNAMSDARPDHLAYNGKKADEDGLFHGPLGAVTGPPLEFNCRCKTEFVKKE